MRCRMVDTHTQGANFVLMGLGMGRGEGYLFLSPFLSRQSLQELGGESRQLGSTAGVSLIPPQRMGGKDSGDAGGFLGEICGGRQAGGEFRGARGILLLT